MASCLWSGLSYPATMAIISVMDPNVLLSILGAAMLAAMGGLHRRVTRVEHRLAARLDRIETRMDRIEGLLLKLVKERTAA